MKMDSDVKISIAGYGLSVMSLLVLPSAKFNTIRHHLDTFACDWKKLPHLCQVCSVMAAQGAGLEVDTLRSPVSPQDGLLSIASDYTEDGLHSVVNDDKRQPHWTPPNDLTAHEPREKEIFGFRKATFWLSVATAIALAFAIVAAAVGGSLAVRRSHELDQLQQARVYALNSLTHANNGVIADYILFSKLADCSPGLNSTSAQNSSSSIQTCATGTITTSSPQATGSIVPQSNNNSCACTPMSDCASLDPTWASVLVNNVQFNISCDTHYAGGDIASFMAYQFEDCINACALYNTYITAHPDSSCSKVSYAAGQSAPDNCALKDATAQESSEQGVDSAVLLQS